MPLGIRDNFFKTIKPHYIDLAFHQILRAYSYQLWCEHLENQSSGNSSYLNSDPSQSLPPKFALNAGPEPLPF